MTRFRDRPTADLIVIVLTGLVATIILVSVAGIFLLEVFRPEVNVEKLAARIGTIISTLVGAIVGYVAGKSNSGDVDRSP
jgi:hypothetical protein